MGSWSVYCCLSNMAITSGDRMAIIPIVKNEHIGGGGCGYDPYKPAMLPIFGTYDDYGGMEDIEESPNTKLIEKYFGITIQEFVQYLVDGQCTYRRDEVKPIQEKILNGEEASKLQFTFVSGKVYDFLSKTAFKNEGHLDFGNPVILELLGFKFVEELAEGRYNKVYALQGKKFFTDGTWGHFEIDGKRRSVFYFDDKYSKECSLVNYVNVSKENTWLAKKSMWQIKEVYTIKSKYMKYLFGIYDIGLSTNYLEELLMALQTNNVDSERSEAVKKRLENKINEEKSPISNLYVANKEEFGKDASELYTVLYNMRDMSKCLEPYILYLTPQCGEHAVHLNILKGFTNILEAKVHEQEA